MLAWLMSKAAAPTSNDTVLEPSVGNGALALWAGAQKASLLLNEIDTARCDSLVHIFPEAAVSAHDGELIADLHRGPVPSVVLMNPPFARSRERGKDRDTAQRHLRGPARFLREFADMAAEAQLTAAGGDDLGDDLVAFESLRERARGLAAVLAERTRSIERERSSQFDQAIVANLEARMRGPVFPDLLQFTFFLDAGKVSDDIDFDPLSGLRWTPGVGVRLGTPVGPLRFDIARGLDAPDSPFTLHLDIGTSF